ncbi:MAG: nicotinamide-nucleotide adenylyltransferase [Candidatus Thermoplasmatota archaeon]
MVTQRGLFIGRFQPFHGGHIEAVRSLAAKHDELIIGIGSANVSHTATNPFTAGERLDMISAALRDAGIANVIVVPIPDVGRNSVWVAHVVSLVPRFRIAYTNNPLPARLFREAGFEVQPVPFHGRDRFEGTKVREAIARDERGWRHLLPDAVARVIIDVDGPERIRELLQPDGKVEGEDSELK